MSEKSTFFKELTPLLRTYELCGQGKKNVENQDKQTTHTVLQKTISKTDTCPLKSQVWLRGEWLCIFIMFLTKATTYSNEQNEVRMGNLGIRLGYIMVTVRLRGGCRDMGVKTFSLEKEAFCFPSQPGRG